MKIRIYLSITVGDKRSNKGDSQLHNWTYFYFISISLYTLNYSSIFDLDMFCDMDRIPYYSEKALLSD